MLTGQISVKGLLWQTATNFIVSDDVPGPRINNEELGGIWKSSFAQIYRQTAEVKHDLYTKITIGKNMYTFECSGLFWPLHLGFFFTLNSF